MSKQTIPDNKRVRQLDRVSAKSEKLQLITRDDIADASTLARCCTASDITFGGKCLNCGGINTHTPQPK